MKDDMIAIFGLKASGKGKEAQGNNLYAVDYVRLYLSLYGVYSKSTHKSGILAPLEGNDVSSFPAPKGFPDMKYDIHIRESPYGRDISMLILRNITRQESLKSMK